LIGVPRRRLASDTRFDAAARTVILLVAGGQFPLLAK